MEDINVRDESEQIRMTVYASLLAALTAAGAYIPIGPVSCFNHKTCSH